MNNQEYWEERSLELMRTIYNSQEKQNKIFTKKYNEALEDIKKDIATLYEKLGDNISISEAYKYDRYIKLEKQINDRLKELAVEEVTFARDSLSKNYIAASTQTAGNLGINFTQLPAADIEKAINYPWSGHMFSDVIWNNTNKLAYNLKNEITRGLVKGSGYSNMAKELNNIMDKGYYNSLRVIRTETAHIVNQATLDRYAESEVVKKVMVLAAEDERTCPHCSEYHLKVYTLGKEPMLPLHANCRCCYAPVVED